MLWLLVLIPLAAALGISVLPKRFTFALALLGTLTPVGVFGLIAAEFQWSAGASMQYERTAAWMPDLGITLSIGVGSIAMLLIGLTVLLGPICVVASATAVTRRIKTYYFWLLVLQAAMSGVFMSRDVILFYVFFEFTLIPMFVLISLYGSTNRKAAAIKFFLYTFTGSVIALAGLVYVAWFNATQLTAGMATHASHWTFDLSALQSAGAAMPVSTQAWVFGALMLGFCVKVPVFPLHTWLPLAHTEAPTAGSVILAGVLLKLGTYGILVVAVPMVPAAAIQFAPHMGALAICGIIIAGLICWVQTDVKKLVAYSSVAHLGFCILGIFSFTVAGLQGAILYMVNHGLSTGALFLLIGMIYERYHTRSMKELGGLAARMPVWATFMVFFTMASVGLPGLNGFISEFLCLLGAFQAGDSWSTLAPSALAAAPGGMGFWFAAVAGTGMIIAAIYLLYMVGKVCFGPLVEPHGHAHAADHDAPALPPDLSPREIGVLIPLAALCIALGIYPTPALDALEQPVADTVKVIQLNRAKAGVPVLAPDQPAAENAAPASTPTDNPPGTSTQGHP
ncbi:MAG: NuoM family protein [Phycisphaerales bacterium]